MFYMLKYNIIVFNLKNIYIYYIDAAVSIPFVSP